MSNITDLTNENFDTAISVGLVLVDFNAAWCGPCQMQAPVLEELASEPCGCNITAVNVDDQPELAAKYAVSSIPCMILFKDGQEVERIIGFRPKKALIKLFEKYQGE